MPYRGAEPQGAMCYRHGSSPASVSCGRCQQPICEPCIVYFGAQPHCHACALVRRRRRVIKKVVMAAIVLLLVGGTGYLIATFKKPFDYGNDRLKIEKLRAAVDKDRCNKRATLALDEALEAAGDHHGAIADVDGYLKKCGDWYRLHWVKYGAHEHLDEHQLAADEASLLIAHNPTDHDYRWWRGSALEHLGQLERAANDYRQTLVNLPKVSNIPFNLAIVYERLGQPCRAVGAIEQFLFFHPGQRKDAQVSQRLQRLVTTGGCARLAGRGSALVKGWHDAHALDGRVKVGGAGGKFLADTQAAYVILTRAFADKLKIDGKTAPLMDALIDGELHPARLITLPEVALDKATAPEVEALVVDSLPDGADGILGLSFLTRFESEIDDDDDDGDLALVAAP